MRPQPNFWTSCNVTSIVLYPLALLYQWVSTLHRLCTKPQRLSIPVISIGNVTVGGAGKTPATIALAKVLQQMGHTPHILTRGYGATIAAPIRVHPTHHTSVDVGDEALMLANHAPTWVHPRRIQSGDAAVAAGATLALCDDALQHHALQKNINLLVIDGGYGVGNGMVLPAGPLRETLSSALKRCDGIILIGEDIHGLCRNISLPVFKANILPSGDVSWLKDKRVIAFAGIARPQKFYTTLLTQGAVLTATFDFPDHHRFSEQELHQLTTTDTAVTTEKDWVRLPAAWQSRIRYVPIELRFEDSEALKTWLAEKLHA